jgi:hypothetical protein
MGGVKVSSRTRATVEVGRVESSFGKALGEHDASRRGSPLAALRSCKPTLFATAGFSLRKIRNRGTLALLAKRQRLVAGKADSEGKEKKKNFRPRGRYNLLKSLDLAKRMAIIYLT